MPRFNVRNDETGQWRCFSTIVDDFITDWMDEDEYEKWRKEEYGRQAGSVYEANQMSLKEAEAIIRRVAEEEQAQEYEAAVEYAEYCRLYEPTYNPEDGSM